MILRFVAPQGPNFFLLKLLPPFFTKLLAYSGNVYRSGPLVGVARKILVVGTKFSEMSMADPLGVLSEGPAAVTTGVGDVDGRPPAGAVGRSSSGHDRS
jgi:hypothetical protein